MKSLFRKLAHLYFMAIHALHRPLRTKSAEDPVHAVFGDFIDLSKQIENPSILEIGSRNVTGISRRESFPHCKDYVGFDVLAGDGVDVVGDAHDLSGLLPQEHFDYVYSVSVFEHLLFPWKAVLETNKIMKTGGYVFIWTHPVWPAHELPWDFWRFPENGFHALFNKYTGFEIIDLKEGLPGRIYSLTDDAPTHTNCLNIVNQGVALIARKTGDFRRDLLKWDIDVAEVIDTMYPDKKIASSEKFVGGFRDR